MNGVPSRALLFYFCFKWGQLVVKYVGDYIILGQFHDLTQADLKGANLIDTEELKDLVGIIKPGCLYWVRLCRMECLYVNASGMTEC